MPIGMIIGGALGYLGASEAADAQTSSVNSQIAAERAAREALKADIEAQRKVADDAFKAYQQGRISYAAAQRLATQATQRVQQNIAQSQLSDAQKTQEMARFTPYGVTTGTGSSFVNPQTGQAGYNLSPQLQAYQNALYGQAAQAAGGIATTPEQAAQKYYQQQMGLLEPQRAAEDIGLRSSQLQRGLLGRTISSEAAGAGAGGQVSPEQFAQMRAREQANAQIAAQATQAGQTQAANQLNLAQGLFTAGYAPEQQGINALKTGVDIGNIAANQGYNQARLYQTAMSPYYTSLLSAADTAQQIGMLSPTAQQQNLQEAYTRQQDQLAGLLGYQNQLYQPALTAPATVSPLAYMGASLGNQLMNRSLQNMGTGSNPWYQYQTSNMFGSPASSAWGASIGAGGE